ncbi:MAG: hypothetical protein IJ916_08300 [Paludibacteraceae bacterium]|nr:hypothetical protein [Paludibacteraceae bacterium]
MDSKQQMKSSHKFLFVLFLVSLSQLSFSQIKDTGHDTLFSYLRTKKNGTEHDNKRSIDNILLLCDDSIGFSHIPKILGDCYYSKVNDNMKRMIKSMTLYRERPQSQSGIYSDQRSHTWLYIYTKSPKSGYLYVNNVVSNRLAETPSVCDSVRYFINGLEIVDCKLVRYFLKIKKKDIKNVLVNYQDGVWLVDVKLVKNKGMRQALSAERKRTGRSKSRRCNVQVEHGDK